MRVSRREVLTWMMGYGPAVTWLVLAIWHFGPEHGEWRVLGLALGVAVVILVLTGVFLDRLPSMMDRLGFRRSAAWLRDWWDEGR